MFDNLKLIWSQQLLVESVNYKKSSQLENNLHNLSAESLFCEQSPHKFANPFTNAESAFI